MRKRLEDMELGMNSVVRMGGGLCVAGWGLWGEVWGLGGLGGRAKKNGGFVEGSKRVDCVLCFLVINIL